MKHQLTIQFREDSLAFDNMITLEDILISKLGILGVVDGHDIGSEEINIFIITEKVNECFVKAKQALDSIGNFDFKAAYRKLSGDKYTILWPKGLTEFKVQ